MTSLSITHYIPKRSNWIKDIWVQHSLTLLLICYLLVGLVLPLSYVFVKAIQAFEFDLSKIEVQLDRGNGWEASRTLLNWVESHDYMVNDNLRASERSREQLARMIPKSERDDVVNIRFKDNSDAGALLLVAGSHESQAGEWLDISAKDVGKVQLRPSKKYSLDNFGHYFSTPKLRNSINNSLLVGLVVVLIVIPAAFFFAYALTRSFMPFKEGFRLIAMIPVLAPSMLPAIGLVYLFGNQGIISGALMGADIYGPIGIIMASVFFTFPHALIIMVVALSQSDQRLYEASEVLGASDRRTFLKVTLPAARYGLISAAFVVFTLTITDFGVPKVIGGSFNMLALDIYKQVIGQQNFQMGAVVSIILLLPAMLAFFVDRYISKRQSAQVTAKAVPYVVKPNLKRDRTLLAGCGLISVFILGIILMAQYAALAKFWPYNLELGLQHYAFDRMDGGGWSSYFNSLKMAGLTAFIGVVLIFLGAYIVEKGREFALGRNALQFFAMLPMAIPGMVLGLAYIFFFNDSLNPLNFIYGTLAILVISTITHLYTVSHITLGTALKQMDTEFESVSMSLQQPFWRTLQRVNVPVCFPAIAEVWLYLFVNAMTTVSAVVFLYSPDTALASVAVLNMDDAGDIAPAAAMALMIFYTNAAVRIIHSQLTRRITAIQAWRAHG